MTQLRETDGRFGGSDGASKAASKADVARDKAKAVDEKTKPLEAEAAKYDHAHKKAMAEIAELRTKAEKADSKSDAKMVEDDKAEERYEVAKKAHEEDPDNKQASDAHERALEEHLEARKLANQAVARANSLGRRLAHETKLIEEDEDKRNHIHFAAVRARERATYAHEKALSAEQKRDDFKEYHAIFEKPWAERGPLLVERAERAERERVAAHLAEREAEEKDREATKRALKTQEPKDWEAAEKTDREVTSALNSKERAEESAERWGRMRDHAPKTTRKSGKREASTMDDRRYALRAGDFNEDDHPREDDGKFGEGGGSEKDKKDGGKKDKKAEERAKDKAEDQRPPDRSDPDEPGPWDKETEYEHPDACIPLHEVREKEHLEELADSMRENGWVGRPLIAEDIGGGNYQLWTGSHRYAAAKAADLEEIPLYKVDVEKLEKLGYKRGRDGSFRDKFQDDAEIAKALREADPVAAKLFKFDDERLRGKSSKPTKGTKAEMAPRAAHRISDPRILRYALRTGEALAISADAIRRDADGFFLVTGGAPPANEKRGTIAVVNVRGALQQYASEWGDSYEAIGARVAAALVADPVPSKVVLRICSPGGVVAGLNECVFRLQRMSREAKIPLIAYADELAASAGYALCCAASRILAPASAVVGSVGVISTMVSVVAHDEKEGIAFRIITSGKRKADGHLHAPITEDAVRAETVRNVQMAEQFFALASRARGLPVARLAALQAGIFLGHDAKRLGLVDQVVSLDAALADLDRTDGGRARGVAPNQGNITDRRAKGPRADVARLVRR